ncbi:MAG: RNA-binding S4 domain-containing protein [Methylophilales bacterium]|nr:RNA-binding S4 domain-containing protein [Methylophilales bacterium]
MQTIEFKIKTEYVPLCDLLKLVGLADSGGRGKSMVAEGLVIVGDYIEYRKTAKIRVGQVVQCGGTNIHVVASSGVEPDGN